ncbi:MAG TPA: lipid II flippase MurJ, partial [Alphaproteobacteria bacterium]|nr:lipid II flippase MurJ [Alphaproteobacteria bacterium]
FAILFSGLLQAGIVAWGVARAGLSLRLRFIAWGPGIKDFFHLLGPGILAGGVVQINIMAGGIIASFQDGARAHLYYADRLYQFPLGLIGVAISVVLLPKLTAALKKNDGSAPGLVDESLITAMFLTLPAAFGLAVLAEPIIATLFEHGRFTAQDTAATAAALIGFAAGLPAYVLVKIFSPSFFARLDTRTPMRLAVLSMVVNITISLIFFPIHGHVAIAWATAVASMVQAAGLIIIMWWRNYHQWRPALVMRLVKLLLASMVMAMLLFFLPRIAGGDWLARFLDLSLRVGLGVGVFVVMVLGLKVVRVSDISRWRGHSS